MTNNNKTAIGTVSLEGLSRIIKRGIYIRRISQNEAARQIGVNKGTLSRIIRKHPNMVGGEFLVHILKWAKDATGVPWELLMEEITTQEKRLK